MKVAQPSARLVHALAQADVSPRSCAFALVLACVVFLMEETMHRIGFFHQGQAIWWPTNGVALALLVRFDRRRWPLILAAVLLASWAGELHYGFPMVSNIVNAVANGVGPLLGALALPRFKRLEEWLQEPHLISRFLAFPLLLAPAASAAIFASWTLVLQPGSDFLTILRLRGVSDMLGYALITPLVLVLSNRESHRIAPSQRLLSTILLLALVAAITVAVFGQSQYALTFIVVCVTLLASMQMGFAASVLVVNILATIATSATMRGHGPLALGSGSNLETRILILQGFLALTMITVLSVSVIQLEREVFQARLKLAYAEMEQQAVTDALTGVGNRRFFEDAMETEWLRSLRSHASIALLMIDVDNFKSYNDLYGHLAGDECLRAVAHEVQLVGRRSSDLLARYGGEEFIFLLPNTTLQGAAKIAEAIRMGVEGMHRKAGSLLRAAATVSVGCAATVPTLGMESLELIDASDQALYRAKQNGRNRIELAEAISAPASELDGDPVV